MKLTIQDHAIDLTEFKFACPFCGQHLVCAGLLRGTQIQCPTCRKELTVPLGLRLAVRSNAAWTENTAPKGMPSEK